MSEVKQSSWANLAIVSNEISVPVSEGWAYIGFPNQPMKRFWFDKEGKLHDEPPALEMAKMPDWIKSFSINGVEVYRRS